ncbi:MAG: hypothetical protein ABIK09_18880 [Pseudomonadota bacterium]
MGRRERLTREALGWTFSGGIALRHLRNHPRRVIGHLPLAAEIPPCVGTPGRLLVRARLVREADPAHLDTPRAWTAMIRETAAHRTVQVALWNAGGDLIHTSPELETDGAGMLEHLADAPGDTATVGLLASGTALPHHATVRLLPMDAPLLVTIADVDRTFIGSRIHGAGDLVRLMWEPGGDRPWLEGTAALAAGWRARSYAATPRAWIFLTGSPWFFLGNLADASRGAGLVLDGLFPRPGPIPDGVPAWHPEHIRRTFRNLGQQAGYKLSTCLRFASTLPRGARLVLLGDDAESDGLAYTALERWLDRSWSENQVLGRVLDRAGAMWRPALKAALEETRDLEGRSVAFIGIRRTGRAHHPEDIEELPPTAVVHDTTAELESAMKQRGIW